MPIRTILLLSFFVASIPVCFIRPFYGILLWTVVAYLNPQSYLWGTGDLFPWAQAVAIPTLAGLLVFSRGWLSRIASREAIILIALWVWFTITSIVSSGTPIFTHHAAETWFRWEMVSKILLMTVVTMGLVTTFNQLRIYLLLSAACFGVFVIKAIPFLIVTGGNYRIYGPAKSMIGDNNDFGLALNMTLPLFLFLGQSETKPWLKRLLWCLTLLTLPVIFFTYSRGALVGLASVLLLAVLRSSARAALVPMLSVGLCVILLFAPEAWKDRMSPGQDLDASGQSRLNAWTFSWNLATHFPITGGGFASFSPELFDRYAPSSQDVHGPHSVYFGVLAEHGFIGLFLYLLLVWSCWRSTSRIAKLARRRDDHIILCYSEMFRFSMVAFLTSGAFLGRAYFDYFFAIVACVVILKRVCETRWHEQDVAAVEADTELSTLNENDLTPIPVR